MDTLTRFIHKILVEHQRISNRTIFDVLCDGCIKQLESWANFDAHNISNVIPAEDADIYTLDGNRVLYSHMEARAYNAWVKLFDFQHLQYVPRVYAHKVIECDICDKQSQVLNVIVEKLGGTGDMDIYDTVAHARVILDDELHDGENVFLNMKPNDFALAVLADSDREVQSNLVRALKNYKLMHDLYVRLFGHPWDWDMHNIMWRDDVTPVYIDIGGWG